MSENRSPNIKDLFDYDRLSHSWDIIPLIVYLPFGLCLFILRLFIGLHAFLIACILPKTLLMRRVVLRVMCAIIGVVVKETDTSLKSKGGSKVIVSNHITNYDHLAIDLVQPCVVPGVWDLPDFLNWGFGFRDFGVKSGRETLVTNVKEYLSTDDSVPILSHPEGATTNGRVGLLRFSSWPFSLGHAVHPVVVSVSRASPFKVATSVLGSRWWSDLFWIMATPWTTFTLKYLEPMKRREDETEDDFAKRVQQEMANAIACVSTNFTDADKVEHAKRLLQEQENEARVSETRRSEPSVSSQRFSPQLEHMALQVKNVMPQVPLAVIKRDLSITANVDETITRLLDGTVTYTPEVQISTSPPIVTKVALPPMKVDPNMLTEERLSLNTGAKAFGKNANDRTKSYEERKAQLIEASKLRYLRKNNMLDFST
ncbi:Lipid droplet-regulating VLDL assembly factor AUP1 [Halotydeus destructor]|nr:Lipid droplet-regulating VLDL assembly factor AUP1 [Halotydeus destructor]